MCIRDGLEQLEHVIFAGFTHEVGIRLAEQLVRLVPPGLSRCFFADNGSAAVEVALKMSFHYWRNVGKPRKTKFVTLANSYHGETLGALAVGNVDLYKATYGPLLMDVITVPSPDCYLREPGESWSEYSTRQFAHMEATLAAHADEVAAVIVEPSSAVHSHGVSRRSAVTSPRRAKRDQPEHFGAPRGDKLARLTG